MYLIVRFKLITFKVVTFIIGLFVRWFSYAFLILYKMEEEKVILWWVYPIFFLLFFKIC